MAVETLGCFGFLTLGWFEITFGASGLVVAFGRALANRRLGYTLVGAVLVYSLAGVAGWVLGPSDFRPGPGFSVLFFLLPLAGAAAMT